MEYDFLKQFSKRMKIVGMFSTLIKNSCQRAAQYNGVVLVSTGSLKMEKLFVVGHHVKSST